MGLNIKHILWVYKKCFNGSITMLKIRLIIKFKTFFKEFSDKQNKTFKNYI